MPLLQTASSGPILERLGWVLLHFLWQGALLAALFWCVNFFLRRRSPNARYIAGCAVLLLMAAAPPITYGVLAAVGHDPAALTDEQIEQALSMPFLVGDLADRAGDAAGAGGAGSGRADGGTAAKLERWIARVERILPSLALAWLVGISLMALWQLGGWIWLTYAVRSATLPLCDARIDDLARRLVRRPVRFLESAAVQGPATLGVIRPIVLLPVAVLSGLTPAQLQAIVAHELAHIRRWDYIVNVLQAAIEAVLFFHPAVWWVSRRVREERENCCDDIAARIVGSRTAYAEALELLERLRSATPPAPALAATGGSLVVRVGRLLGVQPYDLAHVGRGAGVIWAAASGVVLLFGVQLFGAVGRAQDPSSVVARSPASIVYDMLGIPTRGDGMQPVAAIVSLGRPPTGDELRTLAMQLTRGGDPDLFAIASFERMHIDDGLSYQLEPTWRYGTTPQRRLLLDRLLDRARGAVESVPHDERGMYARAAVALAAQETPLVGYGELTALIDAPRLRELTGILEADATPLHAALARRHETSRTFLSQLVRARRALAAASDAGASTRQTAVEINEALRAMAPLARQRPDLQWHLANALWRFTSRAGRNADPLVDDVRTTVNSPLFDRWMAETATLPPPPVRQATPLTPEEREIVEKQVQAIRARRSASPPGPRP